MQFHTVPAPTSNLASLVCSKSNFFETMPNTTWDFPERNIIRRRKSGGLGFTQLSELYMDTVAEKRVLGNISFVATTRIKFIHAMDIFKNVFDNEITLMDSCVSRSSFWYSLSRSGAATPAS